MARSGESRVFLHRSPVDWRIVLNHVKLGRAVDFADATDCLARGQRGWAAVPQAERDARLSGWKSVIASREKIWVEALIREVGKPLADARAEFRLGLALLTQVCSQLRDEDPFEHQRVRYRPHGLVGLITPWNNPFAIPIGKIAPALAYGNGVLWKPALPATGIALALLASLQEAGLAELVALLPGDAATGRLLVHTPEIQAISFTGSVATGRQVIRQCHRLDRPVQAELGGNNAAIVLADADVEIVAGELASAMFSFAGQRCTAIRRVIVEQPIFARFADALRDAVQALRIGRPDAAETQLGPVISKERQQFLLGIVQAAAAAGGRVLTGGHIPAGCPENGCWLEPTVMTDLAFESPVLQDELFGPVVAVVQAKDFDQALAIHNQVEYGLLGAIFSHDRDRQMRFLEQAEAGILVVNQARPAFAAAGPFIGWKASGSGPPEHGRWNRDFYSKVQAVYGMS